MSVSIKYKGEEIASASTEVTKTIKTAGKYCEADIVVENVQDGGGGSGTEVIITSAVTNAAQLAKAIFPSFPNGFDPNAVYAVGWKGINDSTPVNNQIGGFVIITDNLGNGYAGGMRYRGNWIPMSGFTSEFDAAVTIGDKYVWYKL